MLDASVVEEVTHYGDQLDKLREDEDFVAHFHDLWENTIEKLKLS